VIEGFAGVGELEHAAGKHVVGPREVKCVGADQTEIGGVGRPGDLQHSLVHVEANVGKGLFQGGQEAKQIPRPAAEVDHRSAAIIDGTSQSGKPGTLTLGAAPAA
jgi:hypothetical protein